MRLIITGCEYTGKTTLANAVGDWIVKTLGPPKPVGMPLFHDHFTFPDIGHGPLTDDEYDQVNALSPKLKSMIQNHQILYHLNPSFYRDHDNIMVGFHIEDAVYGPLYYDYGEDGSRTAVARLVENHINDAAPDTVLVLLKASPEVIARRMKEAPHPRGPVQEKDIEHVLARFDQEFGASLIRYRFTLDTSTATPDETLAEFVELMRSHMSESDRTRLLAFQATRPK